jgi:DNA-binding phage protein
MSTIQTLSTDLSAAKASMKLSDAAFARACGVTRHSIRRALSGNENFTVTTLLAMADAVGLSVMLVPKDAASALRYRTDTTPVRSAVDSLKDL